MSWTDSGKTSADPATIVTYLVTAVDRNGRESAAAVAQG